MAAPSLDEVVQQLVSLGGQVQSLVAQLAAANSEIVQLKQAGANTGGSKGAWCGFIDKKHMVPEKFSQKSDWREWADSFMDYVEEIQPTIAAQLLRARFHDDTKVPTYPDLQSKKLLFLSVKGLGRARLD